MNFKSRIALAVLVAVFSVQMAQAQEPQQSSTSSGDAMLAKSIGQTTNVTKTFFEDKKREKIFKTMEPFVELKTHSDSVAFMVFCFQLKYYMEAPKTYGDRIQLLETILEARLALNLGETTSDKKYAQKNTEFYKAHYAIMVLCLDTKKQ